MSVANLNMSYMTISSSNVLCPTAIAFCAPSPKNVIV